MARFKTLTQRFGMLYAAVATILAGVTAVVTFHLQTIGVDSNRLIEEAREQTVTTRLITEIDSLEALLEQPTAIDEAELDRVRELLRATQSEIAALEGDADDPSRQEHQQSETRISERLAADLARVDRLLAGDRPGTTAAALELLGSSKHYAEVLLAEALGEADEAGKDLQRRVSTARVMLLGTWVTALLLLGGALGLIHHGVVRPLGVVREGTERFGHGDKEHRIRVDSTDEIGDLARTFNAMADRLSRAQEDLEERVRQRTREFIRAARLADLGILASGIAHEINTPLASIASSAEGLERRSKNGDLTPDLLREYSRVISSEAFRAREITTRMLALARQEATDIARVPLGIVVQQAESALRHRADLRHVRLASSPVSPGLYAKVNAGELVQILVNLLANAVDASEPGSQVDLNVQALDGELILEVSDEGRGIEVGDLERVFEPFYTTKSPGEGTGLGLALVATMVEFRGGRISVDSEVGRGSTFRVTLPQNWSGPE